MCLWRDGERSELSSPLSFPKMRIIIESPFPFGEARLGLSAEPFVFPFSLHTALLFPLFSGLGRAAGCRGVVIILAFSQIM